MKVYSMSNITTVVLEECGQDAAWRLVQHYGGQRVSIPKKVAGRLVPVLGEDLTRVLVERYAGCDIEVPSRGHVERIHKAIRLREDALHSDLSSNELATKHGVTATWVMRLRKELRSAPNPSITPKKA